MDFMLWCSEYQMRSNPSFSACWAHWTERSKASAGRSPLKTVAKSRRLSGAREWAGFSSFAGMLPFAWELPFAVVSVMVGLMPPVWGLRACTAFGVE